MCFIGFCHEEFCWKTKWLQGRYCMTSSCNWLKIMKLIEELQNWIAGKAIHLCYFFVSLVEKAYSLPILSFCLCPLLCHNYSSPLCATLGRLTLSFQTYYIQTQSQTDIFFRLNKSQCLCLINVFFAFSPPFIWHTWVKMPHVSYLSRQRCWIDSVCYLVHLKDTILHAYCCTFICACYQVRVRVFTLSNLK